MNKHIHAAQRYKSQIATVMIRRVHLDFLNRFHLIHKHVIFHFWQSSSHLLLISSTLIEYKFWCNFTFKLQTVKTEKPKQWNKAVDVLRFKTNLSRDVMSIFLLFGLNYFTTVYKTVLGCKKYYQHSWLAMWLTFSFIFTE